MNKKYFAAIIFFIVLLCIAAIIFFYSPKEPLMNMTLINDTVNETENKTYEYILSQTYCLDEDTCIFEIVAERIENEN